MNKDPNGNLMQLGILTAALTSRGLCRYEEAENLEVVQVDGCGRAHSLTPTAATAWRKMKSAALHDGIDLIIISAFRSIARQAEIIQRKIDSGLHVDEILKVSAAPGFSEHHTGRAVDIGTPDGSLLEEEFELTNAFGWLQKNASDYGFHLSYPRGNQSGYQYEPWHWCFKALNTSADRRSYYA